MAMIPPSPSLFVVVGRGRGAGGSSVLN